MATWPQGVHDISKLKDKFYPVSLVYEFNPLKTSDKLPYFLKWFPNLNTILSMNRKGQSRCSWLKAWLVSNSTLYLHPEYLAPPSQYEKHRAFEFGMVNPNFLSKKYRFAYGMGFPSGK